MLLLMLALCIALGSLAAAGAALRLAVRLEARVLALERPRPYPLGEQMGYLQRYVEKLYFAGRAQNWPLADFYVHEVEETADDIAAAKVTSEGVEVSRLLAGMLPPVVQSAAQAVQAKDPALFQTRYAVLVNTCNACHQEARHGFIKITVPERPSVTNQSFGP